MYTDVPVCQGRGKLIHSNNSGMEVTLQHQVEREKKPRGIFLKRGLRSEEDDKMTRSALSR